MYQTVSLCIDPLMWSLKNCFSLAHYPQTSSYIAMHSCCSTVLLQLTCVHDFHWYHVWNISVQTEVDDGSHLAGCTWTPSRSLHYASQSWSHFLLHCVVKLLIDSTFPLPISHNNILRVQTKVVGSKSILKLVNNNRIHHFPAFLVHTAVQLVAVENFAHGLNRTINIIDADNTGGSESRLSLWLEIQQAMWCLCTFLGSDSVPLDGHIYYWMDLRIFKAIAALRLQMVASHWRIWPDSTGAGRPWLHPTIPWLWYCNRMSGVYIEQCVYILDMILNAVNSQQGTPLLAQKGKMSWMYQVLLCVHVRCGWRVMCSLNVANFTWLYFCVGPC